MSTALLVLYIVFGTTHYNITARPPLIRVTRPKFTDFVDFFTVRYYIDVRLKSNIIYYTAELETSV